MRTYVSTLIRARAHTHTHTRIQYSVTDHFRKQQDGFPAVYFIYDISPLMVSFPPAPPCHLRLWRGAWSAPVQPAGSGKRGRASACVSSAAPDAGCCLARSRCGHGSGRRPSPTTQRSSAPSRAECTSSPASCTASPASSTIDIGPRHHLSPLRTDIGPLVVFARAPNPFSL